MNRELYRDYLYASAVNLKLIGSSVFSELMITKLIKSHRDIFEDGFKDIVMSSEVSSKARDKILKLIDSTDLIKSNAEKIFGNCYNGNIELISNGSDFYPWNFRSSYTFPQVFYVKGNKEIIKQCDYGSVACVGSRCPSRYAENATKDIVSELTKQGAVIVSGMAEGIDRKSHEVCLDSNGKTIAVLAGGPDNIYPFSNKDIYERIADSGLILSEMPPGTKAIKQYFPSRNRLISGISDCTFISEAGEISGTLHTASFAAAQGKSVFVLPNTIYADYAKGGLKLILDGAEILLSNEQIINEIRNCAYYKVLDRYNVDILSSTVDSYKSLRLKAEKSPDAMEDSEWKLLIMDEVSAKPLNVEESVSIFNLPFYRLAQLFSELEIEGKLYMDKGKYKVCSKNKF